MRAPPCQRKVPQSSPKQCASQAVNPYPLSTVTHAPRPLTPPTHHHPIGKVKRLAPAPGSGVAQPRPSCTAGAGRPGNVSPLLSPETTPPPPTTSKPREMQRPGFFGLLRTSVGTRLGALVWGRMVKPPRMWRRISVIKFSSRQTLSGSKW